LNFRVFLVLKVLEESKAQLAPLDHLANLVLEVSKAHPVKEENLDSLVNLDQQAQLEKLVQRSVKVVELLF